jgi:hypothetical protein
VLAAAYAEIGDWVQADHFARMALSVAPEAEKPRRQDRLDQYRQRRPFRSSPESDRLLLVRRSNETNMDNATPTNT